jgi:glyoxylase-like metal-dependent hydrolase (beta-lactamase superfamily II)/rhodanese-related sulfurtransferase
MKEINPHELKKKIDGEEDIFLLDVRTPEEYESWKLSYDRHDTPKLIPVDRLLSQHPTLLREIPRDKQIITICAHGNRSMIAASLLDKLGYKVKSLHGGMAGWNKVYDVAEIPVPEQAPFRIWQIRRVSKGCMGYIVSSVRDKKAVVIDPSREIHEAFLKVAEDNGIQITKVIDTHQHADHVSGVVKLVKTLSSKADDEIFAYFSSLEEYTGDNVEYLNINFVNDGDRIHVGREVKLRALHTPGHTNGSMSFLIGATYNGTDKDDPNLETMRPNYLFTGDTLFVDSIGRPDLRDQAKEFAGQLYDCYHQKIARLSDTTLILPAHFNGASITLKHMIPISETLMMLQKKLKVLCMSKEEFVDFVSKSIPPKPMNYMAIISINKKMLPYDGIQIPDLEAGPNSCAITSPQS